MNPLISLASRVRHIQIPINAVPSTFSITTNACQSNWAPCWVIILTRFLYSFPMSFLGFANTFFRGTVPSFVGTPGAPVLSVSFFMMAVSGVLEARGSENRFIFSCAVVFLNLGTTSLLYFTAIYVYRNGFSVHYNNDFSPAVYCAAVLLTLLLDFILTWAQNCFRLSYIIISLLLCGVFGSKLVVFMDDYFGFPNMLILGIGVIVTCVIFVPMFLFINALPKLNSIVRG